MQVAGEQVVEIWSTQLRGDKVLAVVGKGLNDMTYSQGRVLGTCTFSQGRVLGTDYILAKYCVTNSLRGVTAF